MLKTIRHRVIVSALAVLMICGAIAGSGLWVARALADALQRSAASGELLRSHMSADMMHDALRGDVLSALASDEPAMGIALDDVRRELAEHQAAFRTAIAESERLATSPDVRTALARLRPPLNAYIAAASEIVELQARDPVAATALLPAFKARFSALEDAMESASETIEASARADAESAARLEQVGQALMAALVGLAVAFGAALVVLGMRTIVAPVKALAEDMRRLASGATDIKLAGADRADEVGDIGRAVREFQDLLICNAQAEMLAADRRRREEREAEEALQAERAAHEAALNQVVGLLAEGLRRLADGDVGHRVETVFPPEYEALRNDFNAAQAELQTTMSTIRSAAEALRDGSVEIGQAAVDLSRRTEQQAASLEETAATLDEITATVRTSADGARRVRDVVVTAKGDAETSAQVVHEAVSAMNQIEQSSRQIGQIIGVIDEIAFQTNLLALNAGVEAARAGDAGKGFAVVASEVRGLAQRSAEAAQEIRSIIASSTSQVEEGVALVGRTGEALDRITRQVIEVNDLVGNMSTSAAEQSVGLTQVNAAMNQMDQMTQQNAAMVEQSTAATTMLQQQIQRLFALIDKFQVGERLPRAA